MPYTELNLELSEDHEALKQAVHKFSMEVLRPASLELDKLTPEQVIDKDSVYWDCMKKMYQLKYHTVLIPDEYGGMGLDPLANHIFWEELAYGSVGFAVSLGCCCFAPFLATMVPEDILIEKIILPFVECDDASVMSCWAITEPAHGSDILMPNVESFSDPKITQQVKAKKKDGDWVINGQKSAWVTNGPIATNAALFLNLDPSMGMAGGGICFPDLTQSGVSRGKPLDKLGKREQPQGEIYFDDAICPDEHMVVNPESYQMMTEIALAVANAHMGAFYTGVARAAYDLARQYAVERVQGGKLLGRHQSIQKKLFDMFVKVETSRAYSRAAIIYNTSVFPPDVKYSIASKVHCTEAAFQVASDAVQIFGGYGLSKEYPIEKLFRDARSSLIEDGANDSLAIAAGASIAQEGM
jgi:alkylation response protein AidB-like acyl-CoA dehydrogenase